MPGRQKDGRRAGMQADKWMYRQTAVQIYILTYRKKMCRYTKKQTDCAELQTDRRKHRQTE
jgi:hypothetical protein